MNMHNDHPASCLCCQNLSVDLGSDDLSDVTPGDDPEITCLVGVFHYERRHYFENAIHDMHDRARDCPHFSPKL